MRKKKIKAVFTGLNGSCGYETGKEYTLLVEHRHGAYITIEDVKGGGWCEYGSVVSLMENWNNLRVVK